VFVVNKADLPGAEETARTVERALAAAYMGAPGVNPRPEPMPGHGPAQPAAASLSPGVRALRLRHGETFVDATTWVPPVVRTIAAEGRDVATLAGTIDAFVAWSDGAGRRALRARERAYGQVIRALASRLLAPYTRVPGSTLMPPDVERWVGEIASGRAAPAEAATALLGMQTDTTS
jgi:putative protein kinase ArgK-like GTPase of G3E family